MTRTTTVAGLKRLPRTYAGLVAMLAPRPVHDKADYDNAVEMIDRLAGFDLTADQEDYLDALSTFVEAYEHDRFPPDDARLAPLAALKFLVAEHGMTASDLGRLLGNRTTGAAILSGRRSLSKAHVRKLAEHFKVEPGLLL
jgi:antitoxin component HigA of HigAB toxin-antitoxin module